MASYRTSRFPRRSALLVLTVAALFIFLQLMTSKSPSATSISNSKLRIAIVTFVTIYAQRHGYDLFVDYDTNEPRGTLWHKFVMLERVMEAKQHDWIWWIDFDTLITNTTVNLDEIIEESLADTATPNEINFLLTADCFPLNAGSMLVRSRPSALAFLNRIREYGDGHRDLSEQDCIRDVVKDNAHGEKDQTLWIPQWKINAFPKEIRCWDKYDRGWEKGIFVVHFAGAWAHLKEEDPTGFLMRKYESEIIWY